MTNQEIFDICANQMLGSYMRDPVWKEKLAGLFGRPLTELQNELVGDLQIIHEAGVLERIKSLHRVANQYGLNTKALKRS